MHYLVRLIVKAQDAEEAKSVAETTMDDLVEWREFDWYTPDGLDSRWEDCWQPMKLSNKKAQASALSAMEGQFEEFKRTMDSIRLMMNRYTDEQIYNEEFEQVDGHYLSRYQFSKASGYHGNTCQLFGPDCDSIISQSGLEYYLKDPKNLWLVQVDAHN